MPLATQLNRVYERCLELACLSGVEVPLLEPPSQTISGGQLSELVKVQGSNNRSSLLRHQLLTGLQPFCFLLAPFHLVPELSRPLKQPFGVCPVSGSTVKRASF